MRPRFWKNFPKKSPLYPPEDADLGQPCFQWICKTFTVKVFLRGFQLNLIIIISKWFSSLKTCAPTRMIGMSAHLIFTQNSEKLVTHERNGKRSFTQYILIKFSQNSDIKDLYHENVLFGYILYQCVPLTTPLSIFKNLDEKSFIFLKELANFYSYYILYIIVI